VADTAQRDRIVAALTADDSALRSKGVDMLLEFVLDVPMSRWVDAEDLARIVVDGTTGENAARFAEKHLAVGRARWRDRFAESGETPRDLLGPTASEDLHRIIADAPMPKAKWSKGMVDPKLVQQLVAPVVQDTLISFAKNLPIPGLGGGGGDDAGDRGGRGGGSMFGIRKRLKAEAGRLAEKGRDALGGIGAELERQVKNAARDFSENASTEFRRAMQNRVKSPEGKRLVAEIREQVVETVLDTPIHALVADLDNVPDADLVALAGPVADHNHGREAFAAAVRAEIDAALAIEGDTTGRQYLTEQGQLDDVRAAVGKQLDPLVRDFFGADAFAGWLDDVLAL